MPSTFVYRFSDVDKIQDGIGEKLGQFFQYFATFVCGFVIGFIYGWQLTLVIIAVSPLLAIAGGLMAAVSRCRCRGYRCSLFYRQLQIIHATHLRCVPAGLGDCHVACVDAVSTRGFSWVRG